MIEPLLKFLVFILFLLIDVVLAIYVAYIREVYLETVISLSSGVPLIIGLSTDNYLFLFPCLLWYLVRASLERVHTVLDTPGKEIEWFNPSMMTILCAIQLVACLFLIIQMEEYHYRLRRIYERDTRVTE